MELTTTTKLDTSIKAEGPGDTALSRQIILSDLSVLVVLWLAIKKFIKI
ncbi:hypothetical protein [Companilactobacillus furfuricola]|nr:hypothetical protein [Companilactobacillus furfuricola]